MKLQAAQPGIIVDQALNAIRLKANQKNLVVKINMAGDLSLIQADVEKTSWAFINFLTNAIKYTPENSQIVVNVVQKDKVVGFTVKDSGNGIDEKYLPKIFDRYYKVPGTHERSGTGLGLAISREFIEAQHGSIWAHGKIGEGSVFGFSLQVT